MANATGQHFDKHLSLRSGAVSQSSLILKRIKNGWKAYLASLGKLQRDFFECEFLILGLKRSNGVFLRKAGSHDCRGEFV